MLDLVAGRFSDVDRLAAGIADYQAASTLQE